MEANKCTAFSEQIGGSHYKMMPFQPICLIGSLNLDFFQGNVVKYVSRYKLKDGVRDLEKARHYCRMAMELAEKPEPSEEEQEEALNLTEQFIVENGLPMIIRTIILSVILRQWEGAIEAIDALSKEYNQSELEAAKENDGGERLGDDKPKIKRAQQWDVEIVYFKARHNTTKE